MPSTDDLFAFKADRLRYAKLSTAYAGIGANSPLEVIIPAPGVGKTIVPVRIRTHCKLRGCRGLLSSVLGPILDDFEDRNTVIWRLDAQGGNVVGNDTLMVPHGDYDLTFDGPLEVAAIKDVAALDNTALKVTFNGVLSQEAQYILVNYKILQAREDTV